MINFAIVGVGGFIAPKHLRAIKEIGANLVCSYDISDSVGIIDRYFPNSLFFLNEYDFIKCIEKSKIDYLVITTPNFLHKRYIDIALDLGLKVICEKPVLIHKEDLYFYLTHPLVDNINCILQLRVHDEMIKLKQSLNGKYEVELRYFTPRGDWYYKSWKGCEAKSGGILFNIGIHFFDILIWLFGDCIDYRVEKLTKCEAIGSLEMQNASVEWHLSTDINLESLREMNIRNDLDSKNVNFTQGFNNLHTTSYMEIINAKGFTLKECYKSIELVSKMSNDAR